MISKHSQRCRGRQFEGCQINGSKISNLAKVQSSWIILSLLKFDWKTKQGNMKVWELVLRGGTSAIHKLNQNHYLSSSRFAENFVYSCFFRQLGQNNCSSSFRRSAKEQKLSIFKRTVKLANSEIGIFDDRFGTLATFVPRSSGQKRLWSEQRLCSNP